MSMTGEGKKLQWSCASVTVSAEITVVCEGVDEASFCQFTQQPFQLAVIGFAYEC